MNILVIKLMFAMYKADTGNSLKDRDLRDMFFVWVLSPITMAILLLTCLFVLLFIPSSRPQVKLPDWLCRFLTTVFLWK